MIRRATHRPDRLEGPGGCGRRRRRPSLAPGRAAPYSAATAPAVALLGFACDAGVARNHGRSGAASGPQVLRRYLAQPRLARRRRCGALRCRGRRVPTAMPRVRTSRLCRPARGLLRDGHRVVGLGGGHEIAWASYQGIAAGTRGRCAPAATRRDQLRCAFRPAAARDRGPRQFRHAVPADRRARARPALPFEYLCLGISEAANTRALFERGTALGAVTSRMWTSASRGRIGRAGFRRGV